MRYTQVQTAIHQVIKNNPQQPIFLIGEPGTAKTSMCFDLAQQMGFTEDRILLFRPSLRDPVDLLGVPKVSKQSTTFWATPEEFYRFREGTGPGMIIWDELPQGVVQMQNAIAGCIHDKVLGPLKIDKRVVQIATGNNPKDKAGANRVVSQLGNRVAFFTIEPNLDDWCRWAFQSDIDPMLIAFLRESSNLLHDFQPDRLSNPTPRSWELVSRSCSNISDRSIRLAIASGLVGEAAAVRYAAFIDLVGRIPTFDEIMLNPKSCRLPEGPSAMFATAATLACRVSEGSFDSLIIYMDRIPVEFATVFMQDAVIRHPKLLSTTAFMKWAHKHEEVFAS